MNDASKPLTDAEQMALEPRGCPTPGACSAVYVIAAKNAEIARLREALHSMVRTLEQKQGSC